MSRLAVNCCALHKKVRKYWDHCRPCPRWGPAQRATRPLGHRWPTLSNRGGSGMPCGPLPPCSKSLPGLQADWASSARWQRWQVEASLGLKVQPPGCFWEWWNCSALELDFWACMAMPSCCSCSSPSRRTPGSYEIEERYDTTHDYSSKRV